jgi:hypothetical protein
MLIYLVLDIYFAQYADWAFYDAANLMGAYNEHAMLMPDILNVKLKTSEGLVIIDIPTYDKSLEDINWNNLHRQQDPTAILMPNAGIRKHQWTQGYGVGSGDLVGTGDGTQEHIQFYAF